MTLKLCPGCSDRMHPVNLCHLKFFIPKFKKEINNPVRFQDPILSADACIYTLTSLERPIKSRSPKFLKWCEYAYGHLHTARHQFFVSKKEVVFI